MTKRVISVRLTDKRLLQLDGACKQLGMTRSQVIDAALKVFPELLSGKAEMHYDPLRFKQITDAE